ncbi:MAG TPA: hypothetical protein VFW73_00630 [Lacipirellulaceae bacterium]|nr:hypothetical protein [Lacipirellulaceae bacterium]
MSELAAESWPLRAGGMTELFRHPLSQAALWFAVILALLALAVVGLRKWRGRSYDVRPKASDLLTKFREMHGRGSLSDDEYRTIKTKLARQIDAEQKDSDETS